MLQATVIGRTPSGLGHQTHLSSVISPLFVRLSVCHVISYLKPDKIGLKLLLNANGKYGSIKRNLRQITCKVCLDTVTERRTSWGLWALTSWKYVGGVRVCFDLPRMSHSFIQNCCWITLQASHHKDERPVSKMEGKTNFSRRLHYYRLSVTGIVDCLEIIDVIWNSLMAWPDWPWPSYFTSDYYVTATDHVLPVIQSLDLDHPHFTWSMSYFVVAVFVVVYHYCWFYFRLLHKPIGYKVCVLTNTRRNSALYAHTRSDNFRLLFGIKYTFLLFISSSSHLVGYEAQRLAQQQHTINVRLSKNNSTFYDIWREFHCFNFQNAPKTEVLETIGIKVL